MGTSRPSERGSFLEASHQLGVMPPWRDDVKHKASKLAKDSIVPGIYEIAKRQT